MSDATSQAAQIIAEVNGQAEPGTYARKAGERGRLYGQLRVMTLADAASAPPRHYLMGGLIAPGELSLWWGAPKCGKSFLLLRLAYGLALGLGMWGRKAKPCRVLYVAAEGEGGFAARLLVLREELGDAGEAFRYIAQRATVGPPADDLDDVIAAARDMGAQLIVLDTLARTFGTGDENAARDMSGFVASVDRLRTETGAHVAVIHHGTKEGGSSRGSGALVGAADLIVKVSKGAEGEANKATVEAAKDDVDGAALAFRLRVMDLAQGDDGEPRRTCIAEEAEAEAGTKRPRLPAQTRRALGFLNDLIASEGNRLPVGGLFPADPSLRCVPYDAWRDACRARTLSASGGKRGPNQAFTRAAQALMTAGFAATGERDGVRIVWATRVPGT